MVTNKEVWVQGVFDELGALVLSYIKTIVGDVHQAEDILQNVFVKLWKINIQSITNTKAYILTTARNESYTHIRKNKKFSAHVAVDCQIFSKTTDPLRKICIEEALLKLPQEQREIIFLKIYAQLTFQKIADTLKIPINTASSRYRYAMEKLSDLLGETNNE
ncbi:RNA polymerase sigma factor [Candidatus Uabimicrobium sp. HlEnr_7]|uniref:RNA polymerase sigma factor n=1 Tax=Candidatus Uabimicrobium helgolandensis TaxID=3095367 RepID=UPI0035577025